MKKTLFAALGAFALAMVPATYANVQVSGMVTVGTIFQPLSFISLGSGSYESGAGNLAGISWGQIMVQRSNTELSTSFFQIDNSNSSNVTAEFNVSSGGLSSASAFRSMQPTGSISVNGATDSNTVDFSSLVQNSSGITVGSENSTPLALNTTNPYTPSSSVSYNANGINLTEPTSTVNVTNTWTLSIGSGVVADYGGMVTNLQTASVITPEPASLAFLGIGAAGSLIGLRRRFYLRNRVPHVGADWMSA